MHSIGIERSRNGLGERRNRQTMTSSILILNTQSVHQAARYKSTQPSMASHNSYRKPPLFPNTSKLLPYFFLLVVSSEWLARICVGLLSNPLFVLSLASCAFESLGAPPRSFGFWPGASWSWAPVWFSGSGDWRPGFVEDMLMVGSGWGFWGKVSMGLEGIYGREGGGIYV